MKIKLRKTDHCVVFKIAHDDKRTCNVYMTVQEFARIRSNPDICHAVEDCGTILHVSRDKIVVIQLDGKYVSATYCNVKKMFDTIAKLVREDIVTDRREVEIDTDKFKFERIEKSLLGYATIAKHPEFHALSSLRAAAKAVPTDELLRLRELLSTKLNDGKTVCDDVCQNSFYFYDKNGGYNGGIIWHASAMRYCVHT